MMKRKPKPLVLLRTPTYRLVYDPNYDSFYIEEKDGSDAMDQQRWKAVDLCEESDPVVYALGHDILKRRAKSRKRAAKKRRRR